jgi:hypothetical protein
MADEKPRRKKRPRPEARTSTSVSERLLAKARMIAASKGIDLKDYLESVMRPLIEQDYDRMFHDEPEK